MASGGAIKVLGFSGSLRAGLVQHLLLKVAQELAPGGSRLRHSISPPSRSTTRTSAKRASRLQLLISAPGSRPPMAPDLLPEYNYSTSGSQERHRLGVAAARPAIRRQADRPSLRKPLLHRRRARSITCGKSSST